MRAPRQSRRPHVLPAAAAAEAARPTSPPSALLEARALLLAIRAEDVLCRTAIPPVDCGLGYTHTPSVRATTSNEHARVWQNCRGPQPWRCGNNTYSATLTSRRWCGSSAMTAATRSRRCVLRPFPPHARETRDEPAALRDGCRRLPPGCTAQHAFGNGGARTGLMQHRSRWLTCSRQLTRRRRIGLQTDAPSLVGVLGDSPSSVGTCGDAVRTDSHASTAAPPLTDTPSWCACSAVSSAERLARSCVVCRSEDAQCD